MLPEHRFHAVWCVGQADSTNRGYYPFGMGSAKNPYQQGDRKEAFNIYGNAGQDAQVQVLLLMRPHIETLFHMTSQLANMSLMSNTFDIG